MNHPQVKYDKDKIEELLTRSVDTIYPSKDLLREKLLSGDRLKVYCGWDATGPAVHLGHAINYSMLRKFHDLGHTIIVLVGDFTAMIGDPTDKSSARVRLTKEQVQENLTLFKQQIEKVLDINRQDNPVQIVFNSSWLSSLTFEDVIDLSSQSTVQHMIERDTFRKRIHEEKPLYIHEFLYPLMQGYDSVALDIDVEIGGTDQLFNMLMGRTLLKRYKNKDKFVITHPLLEDPETGEVIMSKSKGTGIFLFDTAHDMYLKTMKLPDSGILQMFEHCTNLSFSEIEEIRLSLENGSNPKDIKMMLARTLVGMYHPRESVDEAEQSFVSAYKEGGMPSNVLVSYAMRGDDLSEILLKNGIIESKSEFRRFIDGNSVVILPDNVHITHYQFTIEKNLDVRLGKKKFLRIIVK
jgi:tyrosyl-tRNA synthetase